MAAGAVASVRMAGGNPLRPSLFELFAQDALDALLAPSLRHIISTLGRGRVTYADELAAGLLLLMQHHHLSRYDASIAEHFYGLLRHTAGGDAPLRRTHTWRSLAMLVGLPYVARKILAAATAPAAASAAVAPDMSADARPAGAPPRSSGPHRTLRVAAGVARSAAQGLLQAQPLARIRRAWLALCMLYQLAYLFGRTRYFSPALHLCGVYLQRAIASDRMAQEMSAAERLRSTGRVHRALSATVETFRALLPVAMFFLQFLEWHFALQQHGTLSPLDRGPGPGPRSDALAADGLLADPDQLLLLLDASTGFTPARPEFPPPPPPPAQCAAGTCPICRRVLAHPTVLAVSGYAFCFSCLHAFLQEHARCPVTGLPATAEQMVRLFAVAQSDE